MCFINDDVRQSHVKAIFFPLDEHSLEAMNFSTPYRVFFILTSVALHGLLCNSQLLAIEIPSALESRTKLSGQQEA